MSYKPADFAAEIALNGMIHHAYPNVKAELTLMSTAVKADLTHAQPRDGNAAWASCIPVSRRTRAIRPTSI